MSEQSVAMGFGKPWRSGGDDCGGVGCSMNQDYEKCAWAMFKAQTYIQLSLGRSRILVLESDYHRLQKYAWHRQWIYLLLKRPYRGVMAFSVEPLCLME